MFLKCKNPVWLLLRQERLITPLQKFGRINLMTAEVIFGLLGVSFMKFAP